MAEEDEELMPRASWAASLLMVGVRIYQRTLGHLIGGSCRFHPSCSNYALKALQVHGAWRGGWMSICRICRCHPWGSKGEDPVPPRS